MNRLSWGTHLSSLQRVFNVLLITVIIAANFSTFEVRGALAKPEAPTAVTYNSLSLPGYEGYVSVPNSAELNDLDNITIEAWVFRNETNRFETIVGNGFDTSYWFGFWTDGRLAFGAHGGDLIFSNATVYSGKWNHVAVTYNGFQRAFYINGVLDSYSSQLSGAITPNPTGSLGIGHDSYPFAGGDYFNGVIDEVQIWNLVLSQQNIRNFMFKKMSSPNLVAAWRLDGDTTDETGDHDGALQPSMGNQWLNEGALPYDIRIPQIGTTPSLDGDCGTSEYLYAMVVSVEGVQVSLQHTATDLWACFYFGMNDDISQASLLIDANHNRIDPPQSDDLRLYINDADLLETYVGDNQGGWVITSTYSAQWDGEWYSSGGEFPTFSAEYRIEEALTGEWGSVIGIALDPYLPGLYGIDRIGMWPALSASIKPSTWSSATLAGTGPERTFSGTVEYQSPNESSPMGVGGVRVELWGYGFGGQEGLVGVDTTGNLGFFSITTNDDFTSHRLEMVQLPPGYTSVGADAPSPGVIIDSRTIDYQSVAGGTYASNLFTLGDPYPYNPAAAYGPVFLIIAPQSVIDAGALEEFSQFKTQQGLAVSIRSVEYAIENFPGATALESIRALEQQYLADYSARFQYVMLVGGHDTIPFAKVTPFDTGEYPVCPDENPVNYKYTDWLYVDLTSNPNSNNNQCYIDGVLGDPDDRLPGYVTDVFAFDPTVALGRIPFSNQNIVRQILHNSIGFEKQSQSYKLNALAGMSMIMLKGYYEGEVCEDHWSAHCVPPSDNSDRNFDSSLLAEEMEADFLSAGGFDLSKLYENEAAIAGGQGIFTDPDLTQANILAELDGGSFGLSIMSGHGNSSGVYRTYWEADKNSNGVVDVYEDDALTELAGTPFFSKSGVLNQTDPAGSRGSVYVLLACSNADPNSASNLAATILADGHGPASVASLTTAGVGSWFDETHSGVATIGYYVSERLVADNYRMGESVWWTLADLIHKNLAGSGGITYDLYGDPTLSFFANPGGETSLDPWPMGRRDGSGSGYLPLYGPSTPHQQWDYTIGQHTADTYGPTPLVTANGEVIVAGDNYVDVLRQGVLYQRLLLDDAWVYGSPAVAADGTIYVMDQDANLYAFPHRSLMFQGVYLVLDERYRRWKVDLGENPQASPVIGSDGFVLVGVGGEYASDPRLWIVRQDGYKEGSIPLNHLPRFYAAVDASRMIYVATQSTYGRLYRFNLYCDQNVTPDVCPYTTSNYFATTAPFVTPPLLWKDSVYVGDSNGKIYQLDNKRMTVKAEYTASSYIKTGPVVSPNGDLVFVTADGKLYSLTPDLETVRWQTDLGYTSFYGFPAASMNGIYLAFNGYLRAYNPSSGVEMWKVSLGDEISGGTVALGYGRELYVQGLAGSQVLAFSDGWSNGPSRVLAIPGAYPSGNRKYIEVNVIQFIDPISTTLQLEPAVSEQAAAATVVAILVQRSANGGPWEDLEYLDPANPGFIDTDILTDVNYRYRAQYLMSDGSNSEFIPIDGIAHSLPGDPAAPVLDSVTAISAEALQLDWTPDSGSVYDNFLVERALDEAGPFSTVITVTGATHALQDTGLAPATTYYYRVTGFNEGGKSTPSNVASGTTRSQTLDAPQNFQATLVDGKEIQLTWTPGPAGATAVLEVTAMGEAGYSPLTGVAAADGAFSYFEGEPGGYGFRIKYVMGNEESAYTNANTDVTIKQISLKIYLPLIKR